jgi:RIO-like serine/threonine protein kinase
MWVQHIGALQKYRKNEYTINFEQKFTTCSYRMRISCQKDCEYVIYLFRKKYLEINYFSFHNAPNSKRPILGLKEFSRLMHTSTSSLYM